MPRFHLNRIVLTWIALASLALTTVTTARAQEKKKLEIPKPEPLTLETADGVLLHCTYYPGGFYRTSEGVKEKDGKFVVPIILLHGWEGRQQQMGFLAAYLQTLGHAVIVPDLRGHGRSTVANRGGREFDIDLDRMRRGDILAMVADVLACKRYLMKRNNEEKLNIELLTVVGSELGALVATNWIAQDWSLTRLPTYKRGQDVKAFVLISPIRSFKGATMLLHPAMLKLPGAIFVGRRDSKSMSDTKRLFTALSKGRAEPPDDLFLVQPDASLSGVELLNARGLNVGVNIAKFIDARIVRKAEELPWTDRKSPLAD